MAKKEQILAIAFNETPQVRGRTQNHDDKKVAVISKDGVKRTLWDDKGTFPFKIDNAVIMVVQTTLREIWVSIPEAYTWNGADIPQSLWSLVGSKSDPQFWLASMAHDYLLEFKTGVMAKINHESEPKLSIDEYRRLTSLIFRQLIKDYGTRTVKANFMSWCVDFFQQFFNKKEWK